jgi:hypothetical protein
MAMSVGLYSSLLALIRSPACRAVAVPILKVSRSGSAAGMREESDMSTLGTAIVTNGYERFELTEVELRDPQFG